MPKHLPFQLSRLPVRRFFVRLPHDPCPSVKAYIYEEKAYAPIVLQASVYLTPRAGSGFHAISKPVPSDPYQILNEMRR